MKVFFTIVIFGILSLPSMDAWSFKNPLPPKHLVQPSAQQNESSLIVVPVNTTLYQKYVCMGNSNGTKLLVPGSCSSFYNCVNEKATIQSCTYPTPFYNPVSKSCVSRSTCEERNILVSGGPVGCEGVCCGKPAGLYVDPASKIRFYFCNKNEGVLHECCGGEQFNPINKACDVPANCP